MDVRRAVLAMLVVLVQVHADQVELAVQEYPLPFVRRTVLEFVLPGDEGIAWWEGLVGLCAGFGLRIRYLDQSAIEGLTRWALNPRLEYKHD